MFDIPTNLCLVPHARRTFWGNSKTVVFSRPFQELMLSSASEEIEHKTGANTTKTSFKKGSGLVGPTHSPKFWRTVGGLVRRSRIQYVRWWSTLNVHKQCDVWHHIHCRTPAKSLVGTCPHTPTPFPVTLFNYPPENVYSIKAIFA